MSGIATDKPTKFVKISISPDPGFELDFDAMTVTEELGRPFLIELELSSGTPRGTIEETLGSSVTIEMVDSDQSKTYYNGVMTRISYVGRKGGAYRYRAELRAWIWLLTRTQDCKIFQNMSAWDIIQKVFRDHSFSALSDQRQNQSGSIVLEYCVQYRETAYDFVTRLMEQYGLYYFFTHKDGEHTLVFADDPSSHKALAKSLPFSSGQTDKRQVVDHVWSWTTDLSLMPGGYTHRDYNFKTPAQDTTAKSLKPGQHKFGDMEIYDYPGQYAVVADGQTLADVRMQEQRARLQVYNGQSNARLLRTGVKFTLTDTEDATMAQEYLAIGAVTTMTMSSIGNDTRAQLIDSYRVEVSAIKATTPYRLEQSTPKPMIRGPQTALVVGTDGSEITTDEYGRIKVQFYWDRVGTKNQDSSCWCRVAQTWAGAGWGTMFIPRLGMEVVVAFLEGNPDRPLITGVVYNATQTVPYKLPDNATRSTMKSNSSKGGGGFNELRFEDKKGEEEIFLQAQYDYNWNVLHNETGKVTQDQTITIEKGNRAITVSTGNETVTISKGNRTHTVSAGNDKIDITAGGSKTSTGMAFEVTAGTSIKLTATASIEIVCGPSSIKLDPSGITIAGPMIKGTADAKMDLNGGGMMTLAASMIKIN